METPWTRARKMRHELQEQRLGRTEGGERSVNSGRFWRWKRDGRLHEFLIECRTTENGSYRIDKKEFLDMRKEALSTPPGLLPAMQIDIQELQLFCIELQAFNDIYTRMISLDALVEQMQNESG